MSSPSSCSFRITRTAEDLAQTLSALSQRLIKLEQRMEFLEIKLSKQEEEPPAEEMEILDGVEQLMRECQELLETTNQSNQIDESWSEDEEVALAA